MKAILLSVQPRWIEKILNGEKTIEIRKTAPRCKLPIDVYLYCTKGIKIVPPVKPNEGYSTLVQSRYCYEPKDKILNGKVVAKFTLKTVDEIYFYETRTENEYGCDIDYQTNAKEYAKQAGLSVGEIEDYSMRSGRMESVYAWHISNLQIFGKPMELGEFYPYANIISCGATIKEKYSLFEIKPLTRPPQNYQYVEIGGKE